MAEDKGQGGAAAAIDDEEPAFDAPERGSADELLDAGAHAPIDAMRHSTAHVMAEAVLDLFPGAKLGIGPAIHDGFYYDFDLPRPLTPDDLEAIEGRMRESIAADHPFVRKEIPWEDGRALEESKGQPFKVEILDDLARKAQEAGTPLPQTSPLRARPVQRPVQGPPRRVDRQDRAVQAARRRRRVLAGRREAPDAPADLRHGLGDAGGARPVPVPARGGEEARPPQAGRAARPVLVPRRLARVGVLAPQGPAHLADARGRDARAPGPPRLPGGLDADRGVRAPVAAVRALGPLRREHVHRRVRGPAVQPQADELPRVDVHLPVAPALVPRPAAPLQRVRPAPPQRALRGAVRPHPRPPVHPGRRAHLRPPGPADGRDRGARRRGPRVVRLVRPRAAVRVRDATRQGDRRPGAVGPRGGADQGRPRPGGRRLRRQAQGRDVLRAQDRHLHR